MKATIDPQLFLTGLDYPVRHWTPFEFAENPAEQLLIEANGALRIASVDFEVNDSGHGAWRLAVR
jgi:hypothetical protein